MAVMILTFSRQYPLTKGITANTLVLMSLFFFGFAKAEEFSPRIDPSKFTICTATINSSNEKSLFEEMAKFNKEKFNPVVELTDFGDDWFQKACKSKIRCDQLVISGHFGGSFFGKSGLSLSSNELEDQGCAKTCDGIMNAPYEIFLFGCNTLATKAKDSRSPEAYLKALLSDGIPRVEADAIVESRYGVTDEDNRTRMVRAFAGQAKNIYGFNSIAPSGEHVEYYLRNYLGSINPAQKLEMLKKNRNLQNAVYPNNLIANSLRLTSFDQVATKKLILRDKSSEMICSLRSQIASVDERIESTIEALNDPRYLSYIPSINIFFSNSPLANMSEEQKARIKEIGKDQSLTTNMLSLMNQTKSFSLLSDWALLLETIGVYTKNEVREVIGGRIREMLNLGLTPESRDALCSIDSRLGLMLDWGLIPKNKTLSKAELQVIQCQKALSSDTMISLLRNYGMSSDPHVRWAIAKILKDKPSSDKIVIKTTLELLEKFAKDESSLNYLVQSLIGIPNDNPEDQIRLLSLVPTMESITGEQAIQTVDLSGSTHPAVVRRILDFLHSEDPGLRVRALYFLFRVKSLEEMVQNEILSDYEREPSKEIKSLSARVLENTKLTEGVQLRMIDLIGKVRRTAWQPADLVYTLTSNKSVLTTRAIQKLKTTINGLVNSEKVEFNKLLDF
jgi:hypothetical protein